MGVLSFRRKPAAEDTAQDWSQQELADFFRAHNLLTQNGVAIGMDRGLSDCGEPWMVFFDPSSLEVFLHVARIDAECVLICEPLSIRINAPDISGLIEQFEERVRQYLDIRTNRASNVVIHPAARVIMSISAVFLLLKIDGSGQAVARETDADGGDNTRSKESATASARVQSVMGRLFDAVDNPVAIAALAGMILAADHLVEIGESNLGVNLLKADLLEFGESDTDTVTISRADAHEIETFQAPHADGIDALAANGESAEQAFTTAQQIDLAAAQMTIPAPSALLGDFRVETSRVSRSEPAEPKESDKAGSAKPASDAASTKATATSDAAASDAATGSKDAAKTDDAASSATGGSTSAAIADAEALMRDMFKWDWTAIDGAKPIIVSLDSVDGSYDIVGGDAGQFSVNLDNMDDVFGTVGFAAVTAMGDDDLAPLLGQIMSGIGDFEVVFQAGRLLIEQRSIDGLDASELGMWTNTMSDGSSISIVGAIDLIDDVGQHALA